MGIRTLNLLTAAGADAVGATIAKPAEARVTTYQAIETGTGAITGTVVIEGTNDGTHFVPLATISLDDTTTATQGFTSNERWVFTRARVTAISGTGAAITVIMGY